MRTRIIGAVIGAILTPIALFLAALSTGAGHGDYLAARLLFPLPMLTAVLVGSISLPALVLACLQFPAYGWLIGASLKVRSTTLWLHPVACHLAALVLLFLIPNPYFS